jgi:hypothetical protein
VFAVAAALSLLLLLLMVMHGLWNWLGVGRVAERG